MSSRGFGSGRAFWAVRVEGKSGFTLGVESDKANHRLTLSTDRGYRAVAYNGLKYPSPTPPPVCLQLKCRPQTVGVFLDYEQGFLSFYNVTNQRHIYSFTECAFTGDAFPFIAV